MSRPAAQGGIPRVMIGACEVAGFARALASSLGTVNVQAHVIELAENPFEYSGTRLHWSSARTVRWIRDRRIRSASRSLRMLLMVAELPFRLWCLGRALASYDAFIWLTGRSLLPANLDMPLIRLCGKRQVSVFLGSDSRPPYLNGISAGDQPSSGQMRAVARSSARIRLQVDWCERWCDFVVNHPPAAQYHRRSYLDFASLGFPPPPERREPPPRPRSATHVVRILHAPSRPVQKGTAIIRRTVEALQGEGIAIEYLELAGVSNARVLGEIAASDLVVDELYSDTPLGGLGREAASLGVPCLVCGYASAALACSPALRELAAVALTDPGCFGNRLRELASDRAARDSLASLQREFVTAQWSAEAVGARYRRLLSGDADPAWLVEPGRCTYFLGWGVERESLRKYLKAYLHTQGSNALHLGHDPGLRDRIREFCNG